ncbi:MAG: histidinol dehydrogenase [Firmicutes bacterium]|nr:histidinol dehydrogenase [Bacillota bacterium]
MIRIYENHHDYIESLNKERKTHSSKESAVEKIIEDIIVDRDKALFKYTKEFDKVDINERNILVNEQEIKDCIKAVPKKLMSALIRAKENIIELNKKQLRKDSIISKNGKRVGYVIRPVKRAGLYVPGGKSPYPSSVLMCAIPAIVAGVEEIIMCTPYGNGLNPLTIAAADLCGIKKIYKVGGAQAIGAMAYGTKSIPRVDVITGPGNIYVALAKKKVFGAAGIDMIAGPSEILIIADSSATPEVLAADLLSQAEHDELAISVLITTDKKLAVAVRSEVEKQLKQLQKASIARQSIDNYGAIITVNTLEQACEASNFIAPEHLELSVADPHSLLPLIKNAGAVFMGHYSPEPLGDYYAGPNHVLPTNGTARFCSSLGVDNYIKKISIIEYDKESLQKAKDDIIALAEAEGFDAHANAVRVRFEE